MKALQLVGVVLLLVSARPALAATAQGDAACKQVMDEAAPLCDQIAPAEKKLSQLKVQQSLLSDASTPEQRAQVESDIQSTNALLEQLNPKRSPIQQLNGFCRALKPDTPRTCSQLATLVGTFDMGQIEEANKKRAQQAKATAQDVAASDRQTSNNKAGSGAQIDPVESIQPITVAGGALTLSGTRSGSKGVGTVSVNPLALALPGSFAAARVFDLSASAPFDLSSSSANEDPYISARLRVNVVAPFRTSGLDQAVEDWLKASGAYADKLSTLLLEAKDVKGCVDFIAQHGSASVEACGKDLDSADVRKRREDAYQALDEARRKADAFYLGIDGRFDTGDPTGPTVKGDFGNHGLGGLAIGGRIPLCASLWDVELRTRLAGDFFRSRDPSEKAKSIYSFDWGAAVILSGRLKASAKQRLAFGVGAEGRHALSNSDAAKASPTNYVLLNLMTVVPALTGGDVGLALGIPLYDLRDARGLTVNFSTDLGLLDHSL